MHIPNHLAKTGSEVVISKNGITRVEGNGNSVHFGDENPEDLKNSINIALDAAIKHYLPRNRKLFGSHLTEQQLYEMSLKVVLHFLYMYSNWRRTNENCKDLQLVLQDGDLDSVTADNKCYSYCKVQLKGDFRKAAAPLMGKSKRQLKDYEIARERFENR